MILAVMAMLLLSASGARAAAGRKMLQEVADAPAPGPSEAGAGIYGYDADMVSQEGSMGMKQADDLDMADEPLLDVIVPGAEMAAAPAPGEHPPTSAVRLATSTIATSTQPTHRPA